MKNKYIVKECKKHGPSKFILESRGYYRCTKCRSENVTKKRKKLKLQAIEYLGGKCCRCGYNKCVEALEFHHTTGKDFGISTKGLTRAWSKIQKELDSCILVCANCHREEHYIDT